MERSYSRAFFPSATFYRSAYARKGLIDVAPRKFIAVAIPERIYVIRRPSDLQAVWAGAAYWKHGERPKRLNSDWRVMTCSWLRTSWVTVPGLSRSNPRFVRAEGLSATRRFESSGFGARGSASGRFLPGGTGYHGTTICSRSHVSLDSVGRFK